EVGLSGEIRAVNRVDQRIAEAEKLGFQKIVISKYNQPAGRPKVTGKSIEVIPMSRVDELYRYLF
ncbi:MAG TPA: DNA repair protein RadA, partial [Flavisolibacter sp.]